MQKAQLINLALVSASALAVVACGGDDGDTTTVPTTTVPTTTTAPTSTETAEGLWVGTTDSNRTVTGLVLDDGTYYVLYSQVGNPTIVGGVVQGSGTSNNGSFTSTDARDFNMEGMGVLDATVSASYTVRQSLGGTVMYGSGDATTFVTTYDSQYDLTPSLAALAGAYGGQVALSQGVEYADVTISESGTVTGVGMSGCTLTGSVSPRSSGNVFNISITFGPAPCYFAGQTFTGHAYYDSDVAEQRLYQRLYAAAPNATRTDGVMFIGEKRR
jgi:hypothetical protein